MNLYDFQGNTTDLNGIKKNWDKLMDRGDANLSSRSSITAFKTKKIKDNITKEEKLILIAFTDKEKMSGAKELISFKDGYKLSSNSVICIDCGFEFKGELANGNWICAENGEKIENCTRVSIAEN
jgi:hypothetical protein